MTYLFEIQKHQLHSFKAHAVGITDALKTIDTSSIPKGRKRVDLLAQVCGYKGHTDLIKHASGVCSDEPLGLFSPQHGRMISEHYAQLSGIQFEIVFAAAIKAAVVLYSHESEASYRWKVKDMLVLPQETRRLVMPLVTDNLLKISALTGNIGQMMGRLPKSIFQLGQHVQPLGLFGAARKSQAFVNGFRLNPGLLLATKAIHERTGILGTFTKNPVFGQIKQLQQSPAMQTLRDAATMADRLTPQSLRRINFNKPPKN